MHETMNDAQTNIAEDLRRHGVRPTSPRVAVYALFVASPGGFSVREAASLLREDGIGQATVYRTVELLAARNLLKCVHGKRGPRRFVAMPAGGHAHALVCRKCGDVRGFGACGLDLLERLLAAETGFVIEGHHLEIFGLCPACAGKRPEESKI